MTSFCVPPTGANALPVGIGADLIMCMFSLSAFSNNTFAVIPVVSMFAKFKPMTVVCVPVGHVYMVCAVPPIDPLVLT